jgi:outer membrane lipoprotein-sorting protein
VTIPVIRASALSPVTALLLVSLSLSRGADARQLDFVHLFESRYRPAHTLEAKFLESYIDNGDVKRTEAGIAYFRRPGKMRFEYQAPERDLFLVDGKTSWFYVPGDHTVMRVPAKESTDWRTPLALLAGEMKVSRVCAKVELADGEKAPEGNVVLHCWLRGSEPDPLAAPRRAKADSHTGRSSNHSTDNSADPPAAAGDTVLFEIDRQTGELARLLVRQRGGVQVEFKFTAWRFNPPVQDALFHFAVPAGVTIVNGELPSGDAGVK